LPTCSSADARRHSSSGLWQPTAEKGRGSPSASRDLVLEGRRSAPFGAQDKGAVGRISDPTRGGRAGAFRAGPSAGPATQRPPASSRSGQQHLGPRKNGAGIDRDLGPRRSRSPGVRRHPYGEHGAAHRGTGEMRSRHGPGTLGSMARTHRCPPAAGHPGGWPPGREARGPGGPPAPIIIGARRSAAAPCTGPREGGSGWIEKPAAPEALQREAERAQAPRSWRLSCGPEGPASLEFVPPGAGGAVIRDGWSSAAAGWPANFPWDERGGARSTGGGRARFLGCTGPSDHRIWRALDVGACVHSGCGSAPPHRWSGLGRAEKRTRTRGVRDSSGMIFDPARRSRPLSWRLAIGVFSACRAAWAMGGSGTHGRRQLEPGIRRVASPRFLISSRG